VMSPPGPDLEMPTVKLPAATLPDFEMSAQKTQSMPSPTETAWDDPGATLEEDYDPAALPPRSKTPMLAAAAVVLLLVGAGVAWKMGYLPFGKKAKPPATEMAAANPAVVSPSP